MSNNKYSFNFWELFCLKNNLAFFKKFTGLLGVCFYSFLYTLSLNAYSLPRIMECRENNSYRILGREFVNTEENYRKFPTEFVENLKENLKTFKVSYDLKKGIGSINGSYYQVMGGNLEAEQKIKKKSTLNMDKKKYFEQITDEISIENYLVPITLFSSIKDLVEISKVQNENFLIRKRDSLSEETSLLEEKKFFTIEDHYKSDPKFTFIEILTKDNEVTIVDSNDIETNKLNIKKIIKVSTGKCKLLK